MQFTYSADYLRDRLKFLADSSNGSGALPGRQGDNRCSLGRAPTN